MARVTMRRASGTRWNTTPDMNSAVRCRYDAVVDFAAVVADPTDPDRLNPAYDGTAALHDAVHPNDAGFTAMAAAINLNTL